MSLVTCDVVEAGMTLHESLTVQINSTVPCTGYFYSSVTSGIIALLISSAIFSSSTSLMPFKQVTESGNFSSSLFSRNQTYPVVTETVNFSSSLVAPNELVLTSQITVHEILTVLVSSTLSSSVAVTDVVSPKNTSNKLVTDSVAVSSALFGYTDYLQVNSLSFQETLTALRSTNSTVLDSFTIHETLNVASGLSNLLVSKMTVSDSLSYRLFATTNIVELATFSDSLIPPASFTGWWMNSRTAAMTEFSSLPFQSIAVVNGRLFGLGDAGLFEMTGTSDAGAAIKAYVSTGYTSFGMDEIKRVENVYVGGQITDGLVLTLSVDGKYKGSYDYAIDARATTSPRGYRVVPAKGLSSRYWKFTLSNTNGGNIDIDTINADVIPSANRRV